LLVVGLVSTSLQAAAVAPLPQAKVEQAVIDALPVWHGKKARVIDYLDLTQPFATTSPWALVVVRDAIPPPADLAMMGNASPLAVCFVKALIPICSEARGHTGDSWFDMTNGLDAAGVVFAGPDQTQPLLMLRTLSAHGLNGNASIGTKLFEYDRKTNGFRQAFANVNGGTNNNAATRFVEQGPLRGDVIVTTRPTKLPTPIGSKSTRRANRVGTRASCTTGASRTTATAIRSLLPIPRCRKS